MTTILISFLSHFLLKLSLIHLDLIQADEFVAKLDEDNNLFLDSFDTSVVFKRETSNTLDILAGPDEDLDNLLFKTVNAQIIVTNNATHHQKNQLISQNTEFGDPFRKFKLCICQYFCS